MSPSNVPSESALQQAAKRAFVIAQLPLLKLIDACTKEDASLGWGDAGDKLFDHYSLSRDAMSNEVCLRWPGSDCNELLPNGVSLKVRLDVVPNDWDLLSSLREACGLSSLDSIASLGDKIKEVLYEVIGEMIHSAVFVFGRLKADSVHSILNELQIEPTHNTTIQFPGFPAAQLGIVFTADTSAAIV
jgi:hypothetical protein